MLEGLAHLELLDSNVLSFPRPGKPYRLIEQSTTAPILSQSALDLSDSPYVIFSLSKSLLFLSELDSERRQQQRLSGTALQFQSMPNIRRLPTFGCSQHSSVEYLRLCVLNTSNAAKCHKSMFAPALTGC